MGIRTTKRCCTLKVGMITCMTVGVLMLGLGLAMMPLVTYVVNKEVAKQVPLKNEGSTLYDVWVNTTKVPMYMVYHVYNLTNPEEVVKNGATPNVTILGPFSYHEDRAKFNIQWSPDRSTVSYNYHRAFYFINESCDGANPPEFCSVSEDTGIVTVNLPLFGVLSLIESLPSRFDPLKDPIDAIMAFVFDLFNAKFHDEDVFIYQTVHNVIFGYNDTFLTFVDDLEAAINKQFNLSIPLQANSNPLQQNDTLRTATYTTSIYTGVGDVDRVGQFTEWAGYPRNFSLWKGCGSGPENDHFRFMGNMLNGTEAISFKPNLHKSDVIQVFTEDLMRSADLLYSHDVELKGIDLYRFTISWYNMLNATEYPPNCAFSAYGPSGTINLTDFVQAPVFGSKPSFLDADPYYRSRIIGLPPAVEELHDTFLDIEPITGSNMNAHQRLQINGQVLPNQYFNLLRNIMPGGFFLPVMYGDEQAVVTDELADQFKKEVLLPIHIAKYGSDAFIVTGSILLFSGFVLAMYMYSLSTSASAMERKPLLEDEDSKFIN